MIPDADLISHFQEARRDNLVGIDVFLRYNNRLRCEFHCRPPNSRTSATWPAMALAAAVNGEASSVRPPLPWRPSKFRLLVLTEVCPGSSWSPFIARHILHPASRHSAPASLKILSSPSASAAFFT